MTQEIEKSDHNKFILNNLILLVSVMLIIWGILRFIGLPLTIQGAIHHFNFPIEDTNRWSGIDNIQGMKINAIKSMVSALLSEIVGIFMILAGVLLYKRKHNAVIISSYVIIAAISTNIINVILNSHSLIDYLLLLINLLLYFLVYQILQKIKKDDSLINISENGVCND